MPAACRCNIESAQPNPDTAPTLPAPPNSTAAPPPFFTDPVINPAPPNGISVPGTAASVPYFWIVAVLLALALVALCIWRRRRRRALARRSHRKRRRSEYQAPEYDGVTDDDEEASSVESVHSRYLAGERHTAHAAAWRTPKRARLYELLAGGRAHKPGTAPLEHALAHQSKAAAAKRRSAHGTAERSAHRAAPEKRDVATSSSRHRSAPQHRSRSEHHRSRSESTAKAATSSKHRRKSHSKAGHSSSKSRQLQCPQYSFYGV